MTSPLEKAFLELSQKLTEIDDYSLLPIILQETIAKITHIDWLGLYTTSYLGEAYTVTTNPYLPFNWDELYQEIAPYDTYREATMNLGVGQALIYEEIRDPRNERDRHCVEYARRHTDTVHMLAMPAIKDNEGVAIIGCYRSEERLGFTQRDKEIITGLGPLIGTAIKLMLLHQRLDLKRAAYDQVLEDTGCRPIFIDQRLRIIDLPLATLSFLRKMFNEPNLQDLPGPLLSHIKHNIAPTGTLTANTGPWQFRIKAYQGDVVCHAYVLTTPKHQPVLVIKVEPHGCVEDFSALAQLGFSAREIETLSYLPLGYTNSQIAIAMGITVDGVKKHFKNLTRKLDAQGRSEILYQALWLKRNGLHILP